MFVSVNIMQEVSVLFILTFGSFCSGKLDTCPSFEMKLDNLNKKIVGYSVSEISVPGHHDCVKECMSLSVCKSTDYHGPKNTCKLNEVDSSSVNISEFIPHNGAVFSDISEWPSTMIGSCSSRPCADNQRCIHDIENYYCADITCEIMPSIENGKVVLSLPDKNKFLDTATVVCNDGYVSSQPSVKCQAFGTWEQVTCDTDHTDCRDIMQTNPDSLSGMFDIVLWKSGSSLTVYCDMTTDGGGWTVFQKRFDGSIAFDRSFSEYTNGFGSVDGEFWLGLKYIQEIADQGATELRIDMSKADGTDGYETFQDFSLTEPDYTLNLGSRTGNTGVVSHGLSYNKGLKFGAYDHDPSSNCATSRFGGFWYNACSWVNFNSKYCTPGTSHFGLAGLTHYGFAASNSLKTSSMMIRRVIV